MQQFVIVVTTFTLNKRGAHLGTDLGVCIMKQYVPLDLLTRSP